MRARVVVTAAGAAAAAAAQIWLYARSDSVLAFRAESCLVRSTNGLVRGPQAGLVKLSLARANLCGNVSSDIIDSRKVAPSNKGRTESRIGSIPGRWVFFFGQKPTKKTQAVSGCCAHAGDGGGESNNK